MSKYIYVIVIAIFTVCHTIVLVTTLIFENTVQTTGVPCYSYIHILKVQFLYCPINC